MSSFVKRIQIDLDGVLNEYGKEKFNENHIPKIKNGAYEFIEQLSKKAELHLFTTRNLLLSAKWLIENNLDNFFKDISNVKSSSFLYIDDRAICFKGDYSKTLEEVENFQVYWKKTRLIRITIFLRRHGTDYALSASPHRSAVTSFAHLCPRFTQLVQSH